MSPDAWRLMLFAGGVGGVLVCLIAASFLISHHGHEVPVIAADSRPIRVKPENPGGMQIDGTENSILFGGVDNSNAKLAPSAEVPDPDGIGDKTAAAGVKLPIAVMPSVDTAAQPEPAQVQAAQPQVQPAQLQVQPAQPQVQSAQPQVAAAAPHSAAAVAPPVARSSASTPSNPAAARTAPSTVLSTATGTSVVASASAPVPQEAVAAPTPNHALTIPPAAAPAAHAVPVAHAMTVQLAALTSEPAAREEWQALARRMPDLLAGRQPSFSRVDRDGHVFWRVRTTGFADLAQARAFCDQIRAKGAACTVGDF